MRAEAISRIESLTRYVESAKSLADVVTPLHASLVDSLRLLNGDTDDSSENNNGAGPANADQSQMVTAAVDAQHLDFAMLETSMEKLREGAARVERDAEVGGESGDVRREGLVGDDDGDFGGHHDGGEDGEFTGKGHQRRQIRRFGRQEKQKEPQGRLEREEEGRPHHFS